MRKYHHHAAKMAVKAAFIGRIASRMKCFEGYIAVVLTLLLNGCVDYSDTTQAVSTTIKLTVPTALTGTMALNGHTITLTNADGVKLTATTNTQGEATFANLVPDVYTISAAWNLSFAEYSQATGDTQVNEGAVVSATLNNQLIDQSTTITLPTILAIKRSLVISKVFYAGNKDRNNRNSTAAQYIELYNQSDQPVDMAAYTSVYWRQAARRVTPFPISIRHITTALLCASRCFKSPLPRLMWCNPAVVS